MPASATSDRAATPCGVAGAGSWLLLAALLRTLLVALLRLAQPVRLAFDGDDFGVVGEPIDQGDHARGIGKHLGPFAERAI